ncbi:low molecular weight protein-tyrosine-phosphatase [Altererythrobacter sp. MF3-039]|uniref:low molecular weight protein-tyrosine-phosphatase n=1 Tax=Altererythrobacter sp. MF3-039 TaxID=3252901 RepID=UPI00390C5287
MVPDPVRPSLLFVCLGNICRSPLAEAAFRLAAEEAGLEAYCDSAGTAAYHAGSGPDPRSIAVAALHGIDISGFVARQADRSDFENFTHILALDHENLRNLQAIAPGESEARVCLLMDMVPGREGAAVADPYYGGEENFADTWEDVSMAARAIVAQLMDRAD